MALRPAPSTLWTSPLKRVYKVYCGLTRRLAQADSKILDGIIARIPVGRLAHVAEIDHAVAFLVHRDSGFITGSTLSVNGGQYLA